MTESEFRELIKNKIKKSLDYDKYRVKTNENLLYKVTVNEHFQYEPNNPTSPRRGNYAFQTDLLITKQTNDLPLVVIETKYGGFSTHDILTYSTKAQKHKEVFPFIRYGLLVGGTEKITNKFFIHNVGFDFAFAYNEAQIDINVANLIRIIKDQIKNAELILDIFINKNQTKSFNTKIIIEKVQNK